MTMDIIIVVVIVAALVVFTIVFTTMNDKKKAEASSESSKVIVAEPVAEESTGGSTSKATIHKLINKKEDKSKISPQDVDILFEQKNITGVWICPACEVENPLSESVCCVCHYTKGR